VFAKNSPEGSSSLFPPFDTKRRHDLTQLRRFSILEVSGQFFRQDPEARTGEFDELRHLEWLSLETRASSQYVYIRTAGRRFEVPIHLPPGQSLRNLRPFFFSQRSIQPAEIRTPGALHGRTKTHERIIDIHEGIVDLPQELAMATEDMLCRVFNQTCSNRIQMNIEDEPFEVLLTIHQSSLISTLPQRSGPFPTQVEPPGVAPLERSHRPGQWNRRRPYCEMEVVRKQTPSENLEIIPLFELSQEVEKRDRLLGIGKHILATGEPVVYVV